MTRPRATDPGLPEAERCGTCERAVPTGTPEGRCPHCAADRRRTDARREWRALRRRMEPAPLTRARCGAEWSIAGAIELLELAAEYTDREVERDAIAATLRHLHAAAAALAGARVRP